MQHACRLDMAQDNILSHTFKIIAASNLSVYIIKILKLPMISHMVKIVILECEVKQASESITTNKATGGDGIPMELFQILKDDAVKVLHLIC